MRKSRLQPKKQPKIREIPKPKSLTDEQRTVCTRCGQIKWFHEPMEAPLLFLDG